MIANFVFPISLIGIGVILITTGLLYLRPAAQWDARSFQTLYQHFRRFRRFFRFIWPLGTTPVAIAFIAMTFIVSTNFGLLTTSFFILTGVFERMIKIKLQRPRPYEALPNVTMYQPQEPHDPSHPSGDAMRGWFLAWIIPTAFGLSWPVYLLCGGTAAILSLGRVVLGVHFPLDVLGGTGLGFLAAGVLVIVYQFSLIF
jgi:undecaprenyl-diphosphatase